MQKGCFDLGGKKAEALSVHIDLDCWSQFESLVSKESVLEDFEIVLNIQSIPSPKIVAIGERR